MVSKINISQLTKKAKYASKSMATLQVKHGLICMLDIRAFVILQLDFPLCLGIVAKNEIKSLLRSGGTCCCYTWTDKLLLQSGVKCCRYAWNDKLKTGRII